MRSSKVEFHTLQSFKEKNSPQVKKLSRKRTLTDKLNENNQIPTRRAL